MQSKRVQKKGEKYERNRKWPSWLKRRKKEMMLDQRRLPMEKYSTVIQVFGWFITL